MKRQLFNRAWIVEGECWEKKVTLPYDAMIKEEKDPDCANAVRTGYYPGKDYVYKKEFQAGDEESVFVEFESIYKDAEIYLNKKIVKSNHYGYSRILVDLSDQICKNSCNELMVRVHNSDEKNSRWYSGSGIYRDVYMMCGGNLYIRPNGVKITVDEVDEKLAVLTICTWIRNKSLSERNLQVVTELRDNDNSVVSVEKTMITACPYGSNAVEIYQNAEGFCRQRIYVRDPKLWSDESPNLYTYHVSIYENNQYLDSTEEITGIRKIQLDPIYGLRINNKSVKLRGGCIHHDLGVIGAASFQEAENRRVRKLKDAGFNAIRMSHHPISTALLRACDQYGMYVMDEAFDMWELAKNENDFHQYFEEEWLYVIEDMVSKDYNHPCVIMYSIGNEIHELGTSKGRKINRNLVEKVHSLDHTRAVTQAINGMTVLMDKLDQVIPLVFTQEELEERHIQLPITDINDALTILLDRTEKMNALDLVTDLLAEVCGALDIVGYNYATGRYMQDHEMFQNRILMGSETFPSEINDNWAIIKKQPYILGDFTWTAWDYIGETGIGTIRYDCPPDFSVPYPCGLADTGDFDIIGQRKAISYYREAVWELDKQPFIGVQNPVYFGHQLSKTGWGFSDVISSWTWYGFENKFVHVEVYSSADEVELLINGQSYGRQPAGEAHAYKAIFDVVYTPGKIEAIAYKNGEIMTQGYLQTADHVSRLLVKRDDMPEFISDADKILESAENESYSQRYVKPNGLIMLEIACADEAGRINMNEDKIVTVNVRGSGTLVGFGNADPYDVKGFNKESHKTWHGHALAAVRAGDTSGIIEVDVQSLHCKTIHLSFEVK